MKLAMIITNKQTKHLAFYGTDAYQRHTSQESKYAHMFEQC